jgi:hypothetical protein
MRSVVVLPAPFGPSRPKHSFAGTARAVLEALDQTHGRDDGRGGHLDADQ